MFLGSVASAATAITVIGFTIALFFNPLWIAFEQERADVPAITGYTPAQVRTVTGSILSDVIIGPPVFAAALNGRLVLDPAERSHMVDVYNLLRVFGVAVGIAIVALIAMVAVNRPSAWIWRAIARGSGGLVLMGVVVGVAVLVLFDAAFLLFHRVLFPQGNFSFDSRIQRLPQLFPDQFWSETSIGIAVVGLAIAIAVTLVARRLAARPPD